MGLISVRYCLGALMLIASIVVIVVDSAGIGGAAGAGAYGRGLPDRRRTAYAWGTNTKAYS